MSILAAITGVFTIAGRLASAYEAKQKAATDRERIAADVRIKRLEAIANIQAAEGGSRINAFMRAALAAGPTVYLLKIFVWDKVLGLGATDALSPELWNVVTAVVGFYFLYEASTSLARILKR
jgi:hypothetical protein